MKTLISLFLFLTIIFTSCQKNYKKNNQRLIIPLEKEWYFINSDIEGGELPGLKDNNWEIVQVPHDWAIKGPFDEDNDAKKIQRVNNGVKQTYTLKGLTGGLPHVGVGWYRKYIEIPDSLPGRSVFIEFDGAMSHARVFLNGDFVGEWPYGYASFGFDLTDKIKFGQSNLLAVRLENLPESSRWYPGAGLYRNVRLVFTNRVHVKRWGTYITTPDIDQGTGNVVIKTIIHNQTGDSGVIKLITEIADPSGKVVTSTSTQIAINSEAELEQQLNVEDPFLWTPEDPQLYSAVSKVIVDGKMVDRYVTRFGFRYFHFDSQKGFYINDRHLELKGVCLHHDLGPLGAAVNKSAIRRQLKLLQEMGCNAIRTSHNPPAPELLDLCDEMGFLVLDEAFDEWKYGKCKNGYNTLFEEWAEKDLRAFIRRDRNHPSVIMWSIGNEIREQSKPDGAEICQFLTDICHEEDPTRPVTAGFNSWKEAMKNGLADIIDVPGWNYKPQHYKTIHANYPDWKMYASETASTVSSRGEYFQPAEIKIYYTREPYHSSSYDLEFPWWATTPDVEFMAQDSCPFIAGEFVWTGFDYLGEPTPYNVQWPARSSYFGIIDLCGIPKDRFYLYQSRWSDKEVLHLLPHWNWEGHEGKPVSVHCYTSFNAVELFLNGKSMGIREKDPTNLYGKYRLIWDEVLYEPGELKAAGLDKEGNVVKETIIKTASSPAKIELVADRKTINANGKDLSFVTVRILDKNGILCPKADNLVKFSISGGSLRAAGNGDPTSLESFTAHQRKAFNGLCMAIIHSGTEASTVTLTAESKNLQKAEIIITTNN